MIKIELDLDYLKHRYDVNTSTLMAAGKGNSIEDIMAAEEQKGNTKVKNFNSNVLNDVNEVIEIFNLDDAVNRYEILSHMNRWDLLLFLVKLNSKQLSNGLKFYNKDKILELLSRLPQEKIFKLLLNIFSREQILKLIPEKQLNAFLASEKMKDGDILKYVRKLPAEALAQILQTVTGVPCKEKNPEVLYNKVSQLQHEGFSDGLAGMNKKYKEYLILRMISDDPEKVNNFSKEALVHPLKDQPKNKIVEAAGNSLSENDLLKLIDNLPDELLSMVGAQLNEDVFSSILIDNFKDILSQIELG